MNYKTPDHRGNPFILPYNQDLATLTRSLDNNDRMMEQKARKLEGDLLGIQSKNW